MRKIFVIFMAVLILTSMGFASVGKLNVWVRSPKCQVVLRPGHLHVYDCQGTQVLVKWFMNGHAEVELPPGCYIVNAGIYYGNIYTDKTMVIVQCGKESCVNLVLADFEAHNPPNLQLQPVIAYYCPAAILPALIVHGTHNGINQRELWRAVDVIARAAKMDKDVLLGVVKSEIKMLEKFIPKCKDEKHQMEMKKYLGLLKKSYQTQDR